MSAKNSLLIAKTLAFTAVAPGLVAVVIPMFVLPHAPLHTLRFDLNTGFGTALVLAGSALYAWCAGRFVFEGKGTPAPFDPPKQLVVGGPYRMVRNPMYLGGALVLLGEALCFRSFWHLAYAGLFVLLSHIRVVLWEEPALRRAFGAAYDDYCHQVPRWLPRTAARNC